MSLIIPHSGALSVPSPDGELINLDNVRRALSVIKSAYDNRDSWNQRAHEHESREMKEFHSQSKVTTGRGSSRSGGRAGAKSRVKSSDLSIRPPTAKVPTRVPRNILNRIVWATMTYNGTTITTSLTALTENNFNFQLNNTAQYSSWTTLFDQFTIVQASVTLKLQGNYSSTGNYPELYTAIDFDNISNLNSIQLIENYASAEVLQVRPNSSVTRSCKPCLAPDLSGVSGAGVQRAWVDCAQPGIPAFGIRTIFSIAGTQITAIPIITMWIAFRTNI